MKNKLLVAILLVAAHSFSSNYVLQSSTGRAPFVASLLTEVDSALYADSARAAWKADSARIAFYAHASTYADTSRVSGLADSALHAPPSAYADSSRASHVSDSCLTCVSGKYLPLAGGSMEPTAHVEFPTNNSILQEQLLFPGLASSHQYPAIRINRPYNVSQANDYGLAITSKSGWCMGLFSDSSYSGALYIKNEGQYGFAIDIFGSGRGIRVASGLTFIGGQLQLSESKNGILRSDVDGYVFPDTNNYLTKSGTIATSDSLSKRIISDSLTANARAWTTLTAAKSSIHDSLTVERAFDSIVSRSVAHDTATALRAYIGSASTTGNAATSTKLATARTISMTGDGTWSTSFDGWANATGALTLATVNSNVGSFGSGYQVPYITVNAKGQVTSVANYNITIPHTQISDWGTATSSFLTANQAITLKGAVTGSGTTSIATTFANTYLAGINQDLTTTSSPTFAAVVASNSYYGVVGIVTADARKWYLVATVDITNQYNYASAVIRFNSVGGNAASGLGGQWAGSCFIRAKQMSAMSSGLDNFTIGWNYCHGFNPSSAVIGVKTTDNASHKIVNIYLLCPASYDGMSWQIDNLAGSITASGVGTNYVTTLPTGLVTYTGSSAIWSDWTNITIPGASTFTGLITANGGISGNLTGHASLDIPLTGSSAITGNLTPSITAMNDLGTLSKRWGAVYAVEFSENGSLLANKYAALTANGGLNLAVNLQSATYTISAADQGKMVVSTNTLNLPSFSAGTNVGFWCLVNWHVGGGGVKFGPTTTGTPWYLRGVSISTGTSTPFTGIVSWDGYNWYAN